MDFFIESRYTLEESRRFARVINHRSPRFWIARCLVPVLMIAYSIFLLQKEMYMIAGFFFLVMMLLVGLGEYLRDYRSRKLWEESAALRDERVLLHFTEEEVEVHTSVSQSLFSYDKFTHLLETRTHLYPMLSSTQGILVVKEALTPDQLAFIRSRLPQTK